MELFEAAGVELPRSENARARRRRALDRALGAPLFNYKAVRDAISRSSFAHLTDERRGRAAEYARKAQDVRFLAQKEMSVREVFVQDILQTVLGYTSFDPGKPYSLARERAIRSGSVDVALGKFNLTDGSENLVAPFELKGPDNYDLDRVIPGRGRSAVQQAWDYAIDSPGARWVLVSNCVEIRLYGFGRGRAAYERFNLTRLDDNRELERLFVILSERSLLEGGTDKLLRDSDTAYKDITSDLYAQYKDLRVRLIRYLLENVGVELELAVSIAQKLLDRILFIAFAQRTDLMADGLLEQAAKTENSFAPQPLWQNFLGLFKFVDEGNAKLDIPPYNGGLFAEDLLADKIMLPDFLARDVARLGHWDYRNEVPVTVLGHIFEQSITDLELLRAGPHPEPSRKKASRVKREGVVYTPDPVTRFLVGQTIARALDEKRDALWAAYGLDHEASPDAEAAFWKEYLHTLLAFKILDPACGSGAFLVAAFDEMAQRYRDAVSALDELGVEVEFDVFDQIVRRNLYGVDVNAESVEITRLSLWLKTARRDHRLQSLENTIRVGNSLISDVTVTDRPFDWVGSFPDVFSEGGFDIVIGNPPYVRMEHLTPIKPYLAKHYVVADERTDLSAYFFEKGAEVLKPGGRLGYISTSTFFRTGSGEKLRRFLGDSGAVETIIDFGDVQLFGGVTTYPAIITFHKGGYALGDVQFLSVRESAPDDLARAFSNDGQSMPRARLTSGSWQLEDDRLAALRAKMADGRKTLAEVYGAPLYGIKTGLNEAFVIDRQTHDRLVDEDPTSVELLRPFLRGEDVKRWRVEGQGLHLINTPKGLVDIDAYPAVKAHLWAFKEKLIARATKQEWWELQQAQLAYQDYFDRPKIVYQDIANSNPFALDDSGNFLANTCYFMPLDNLALLSYLNSKAAWFIFGSLTNIARGGYLRLRTAFVERLPVPNMPGALEREMATLAQGSTAAARTRFAIQSDVCRRILDLAPAGRRKLSERLQAWHELNFADFLAEVRKVFRVDVPLRARGEWEEFLSANRSQAQHLSSEIAAAELELDSLVYRLFDLTPDDIALLEGVEGSARSMS